MNIFIWEDKHISMDTGDLESGQSLSNSKFSSLGQESQKILPLAVTIEV